MKRLRTELAATREQFTTIWYACHERPSAVMREIGCARSTVSRLANLYGLKKKKTAPVFNDIKRYNAKYIVIDNPSFDVITNNVVALIRARGY